MSLKNDCREIELILANNEAQHEVIRDILKRIRDRDRVINQQATIQEKNNNECTEN